MSRPGDGLVWVLVACGIAIGSVWGYVWTTQSHRPAPAEETDLALFALNLSKDHQPDLDIEKYSQKIDSIAYEVRAYSHDSDKANDRIAAMNWVIYNVEGFAYDTTHIKDPAVPADLLAFLLETKRGNCLSLPTLYLAVAQRLGYPIYHINMPGHLALRYVDGSRYKNIEPTWEGKFVSDAEYIKGCSITQQGIDEGLYLRTMSYREFKALLYQDYADGHLSDGDQDKYLAFIKKSLELDPKCGDAMVSMAHYYMNRAKALGVYLGKETPAHKAMRERYQ